MKRSIISAAVPSTVFMSARTLAVNEINMLTVNGAVENSSYYFKNNDAENTITLSNIDALRFSGLSTGTTVGDEKEDDDSTPMVIMCPAGIELNTIRIIGAQFASGILNKTSGGTNGIDFNLVLGDRQIADAEESNLGNRFTAIETDDRTKCTLDFKAKYAHLSSDVPITAETLSSILTISISAD